ncbi:MAG TPA: lysylphosphatidylglycerol synthase transmembrane domain-containing protein [Bryobacteraceae bacterium]|nr:lysylphosphatidylglycerol synthase transmembrane domain-containing protein [Bryobacteraceae bacterium]
MSKSTLFTERGRRRGTYVFSILLAGVLLYSAVRGVDWARVWSILATIQWEYVAIGTGFTCCAYLLRSLRWRILLNAEGSLDVLTVFWANMAGYLGNNFLPARAGELVRSVLISSRSTLTKTYVLTTALSERLMDVIALALAGSLALWVVSPQPHWMAAAARTMALAGLAGVVAAVALPHTDAAWMSLLRRLPLPPVIAKSLTHILEQIFLGLRAFHDWQRFWKFALLTGAVWFSDACATVIGGRALGLHVSFPVAVLLIAGLGFSSAIPATPGFIGIYQFIYVSVLTLFGISRDGALAFSLVSQVMGYLLTLALGCPGFFFLQRSDSVHHLPAELPPAEA